MHEAISGQNEFDATRPYGNLIRYADALATLEGFGARDADDDTTEVLVGAHALFSIDDEKEAALSEGLRDEVLTMCAVDSTR